MTTRAFVTPADPVWRQCHGSTLVVCPHGEILVAFFAGTGEGTDDNRIYVVRGDGAGSWSTPRQASPEPEPHWNPVLAWGPDQDLWLFYKVGTPISQWRTRVRRSSDQGRTWSNPVDLVPGDVGGRGPVKNPPVLLTDGTWIAGGSVEAGSAEGVTTRWDAFADVSADAGRTWRRSADFPLDHGRFPGAGVIQPTLWASPSRGPASVTALVRSTAGRAWRTTSGDAGLTWAPLAETNLPNNNSGLCGVALPDGRVVVAHNPSDIPWGPRNELVVSQSRDDGRTFTPCFTLDRLPPPAAGITPADGGVMTDGVGELSYPTLVLSGDRLFISYTWQRRRIMVATVGVEELDTPPATATKGSAS